MLSCYDLTATILMCLVLIGTRDRVGNHTLIVDLRSRIINARDFIISQLHSWTLLIESWVTRHRRISCIFMMLFLFWLFDSELSSWFWIDESCTELLDFWFLIKAWSFYRLLCLDRRLLFDWFFRLIVGFLNINSETNLLKQRLIPLS